MAPFTLDLPVSVWVRCWRRLVDSFDKRTTCSRIRRWCISSHGRPREWVISLPFGERAQSPLIANLFLLRKPSFMPHVIIIGAGVSGLSLAYRLRQSVPVQITILEKASRVGGNIRTEFRDGFRVECGPNGFLDTKPSTLKLCHDLGLSGQLLAASEESRKNRYLFWKGKLQAYPIPFGRF